MSFFKFPKKKNKGLRNSNKPIKNKSWRSKLNVVANFKEFKAEQTEKYKIVKAYFASDIEANEDTRKKDIEFIIGAGKFLLGIVMIIIFYFLFIR